MTKGKDVKTKMQQSINLSRGAIVRHPKHGLGYVILTRAETVVFDDVNGIRHRGRKLEMEVIEDRKAVNEFERSREVLGQYVDADNDDANTVEANGVSL